VAIRPPAGPAGPDPGARAWRPSVAATPVAPPEGADLPFLDLASGYVQRSLASLPKQGSRTPWRLHQNYIRDVALMRRGSLDDEGMTFQRRVPAPTTEKAVA
jgi:monooxygenase